MVKIVAGACVGTVVTCTDASAGLAIIPGCTIIGEGRGPSTGIIFISDAGAYYVPTITADITSILSQLVTDLTSISTSLTAMQASLVLTGYGAGSAPVVLATVAQLTTSVTTLSTLITMQK